MSSIKFYYIFYPETETGVYYKIIKSYIIFLSKRNNKLYHGKYNYFDKKSIIKEIEDKGGIKLSPRQWYKRIRNEKIYLCKTIYS